MKLPQDVIEALKAGRKIEAIKRLREARPIGLKEAKETVEKWQKGHPEVFPSSQVKESGSFLLTVIVFAAFGWMFINLVDVMGSLVVLAHHKGYQPAVFVVETVRHETDGEGGLMWGFEGKVGTEAERYNAPSLADGKRLGHAGLRRLYPPGTELEVWYNPEVTDTLFQGRTLNVLPFTEDLVATELARLRWWVAYCLLPFIVVAVFAARLKGRSRERDDRSGLPPALGPTA